MAEPTVQELLTSMGNFSGSAAPKKNALGVPNDYKAKVTSKSAGTPSSRPKWGMGGYEVTTEVAPRYFDGDEWRPASQPPDKIAEQQRALVDAGLLKTADYHSEMGSWGENTVSAYAKLLQNANASGKSADDALATFQATAVTQTETAKVPEPLVVNLTNPDDIRGLANAVAVRRLGKRLSQAQLDHHVAAWQQSERQVQEESYRMRGSGMPGGPGGTVAPSAASTAAGLEENVRADNPQDAASYDAVQRFSQFEALLRGAQ